MRKLMAMTLWLSVSAFAMAAETAPDAEKKTEEPQKSQDSAPPPSVLTWLDMQRSGSQASKVPQTLTPVIQERVVKRYLDSFNAPIPVFFMDESSTSAVNTATR